jgi:hypothetical protein
VVPGADRVHDALVLRIAVALEAVELIDLEFGGVQAQATRVAHQAFFREHKVIGVAPALQVACLP